MSQWQTHLEWAAIRMLSRAGYSQRRLARMFGLTLYAVRKTVGAPV